MRYYVVLAMLIAGYIALLPIMDGYSRERMNEKDVRYIPKNELIDLSVLEFRTLAADIFFLNGLTFVGGHTGVVDPGEWEWLYKTLDASSYLNPYNIDPYFLAQGALTWFGKLYPETNALLERGLAFRKKDWRIPFFIGFNYYYFLEEPEKGAHYIAMAAETPDSPKTSLVILSSRLYSQSQRTELAIAIVKDDYEKEREENLRSMYKNRLESLQNRMKIEKAVEAYEKHNKRKPLSLNVLVSKKYLNEIPADPEGGTYFLDDRGKVENSNETKTQKRWIK